MARHFEAFDKLRAQGYFVGEMIWNFADFKTAQSKYKRISTAQCGQFSHE
jgi:beta-glucuronidase